MISARAVITVARVATHGISCRLRRHASANASTTKRDQHHRSEGWRQNLEAHRGLPQQRGENERGRDSIGGAGKAVGSMSADGPNHPQTRVYDGKRGVWEVSGWRQILRWHAAGRLRRFPTQPCPVPARPRQALLRGKSSPGGGRARPLKHSDRWRSRRCVSDGAGFLRLAFECGNAAFQFAHSFTELFYIRCDAVESLRHDPTPHLPR